MNSITRDTPLPIEVSPCIGQLVLGNIKAGFPSPAEDFAVARFDLLKRLVPHPATTFFMPLSGLSMIDAGLFDGDWLVVDKVIRAVHNNVVVAVVDGEFTCKRLYDKDGIFKLCPANADFPEIIPKENQQIDIWGVVTFSIRPHR